MQLYDNPGATLFGYAGRANGGTVVGKGQDPSLQPFRMIIPHVPYGFNASPLQTTRLYYVGVERAEWS